MRVAIIGAGGHAKVVADAAIAAGCDKIIGYLDDDLSLAGCAVIGLPVLGKTSAWRDFGIDTVVPAIGSNRPRRDIIRRAASEGATVLTIIHPSATVSAWATLHAGVTAMAGSVINAGAIIGENTIINTGAIVEHDCRIGSHVHVAPGCCVAGEVRIGDGTFLGIGSRVLPGLGIGDWCVVGAGAVVTRDIDSNRTVVGVPARIVQ
jgi:sugar O-acyltransferase (sialic acid O-acetyltransferase NeuD family)